MAPHSAPFVPHTLALALVKSSAAPVLLLDGSRTALAASTSFCRTFQLQANAIVNRPLAHIGAGEWDVPQLAALLKATGSGFSNIEDYEMDFAQKGKPLRKLMITATKLDYADSDEVRIILTAVDVTDARAAEKQKKSLLRDKNVLLQEIHHRVANSLQIIASVLMQSARNVQSEETRTHLNAAHHRVLSVGAMQQHLMPGGKGAVELRSYFTQLCQSLAASMIPDPDLVTLTVDADQSWLDAEDAVSLGLIVTELTINALKHAFPGGRSGDIVVEYRVGSGAGTLSVSDNGVGMVIGMRGSKPGLGTSIVEALVRQLGGDLVVSDNAPGTRVTMVNHREQLQAPVAA